MKGYLKRNSAAYFHNAVKNAKSIAILTHTNPDGDALGSVTALKWYLAALGINSRIVVPNPYPKNLKFLDKELLHVYSTYENMDLYLVKIYQIYY